jgi:hypothetical protein
LTYGTEANKEGIGMRHKSGTTDDKGKCWNAFSQYIRVRDCLRTTGLPFVCECITCKRRFHISNIDAGHCFAGRTNAKLLLAKFVFGQCHAWCNFTKNGDRKTYERLMRERYGDDFVDRAIRRMNKVIHDNQINWVARTERYKRKLAKLMRAYGYKTFGEILKEGRD